MTPRSILKKTKLHISKWPFILCSVILYMIFHTIYLDFYPEYPKEDSPPIIYCNEMANDLRWTMLSAIKKATSSIYLVMFGLKESSILSALAQKATESIVTDIYYDRSASFELTHHFTYLRPHAVECNGLMHQKILIVDDSSIFLGSANMTTTGLNINNNLMIGFQSKPLAKFLKKHPPFSAGYFSTFIGDQQLELFLLPDPRGEALTRIKRLLTSAKSSIFLAMFTFTHPALVDALIQAHQRGVSVIVSIDSHSATGTSRYAIKKLKNAGIKIVKKYILGKMHYKLLYVDKKTALFGSANWTKAAFYHNCDCFVILHSLTSRQRQVLDTIQKNSIILQRTPI